MTAEVDIIKIEQQLPVLTGDFEAEKLALSAELDKYKNVLVTEETLKDDKKLAGSLSAKGKAYNSERIRIVGEISKPIVAFTGQMKELSNLCADASSLINDQVKVFEAAKLNKLQTDLLQFLLEMRDSIGIDQEFRRGEIDPKLIKLGSITAKGAIAKSAKDSIVALVTNEHMIQQRTAFRLLQLESESHKAGLLSPLDRISVETFLFAEDEAYQQQLARVIEIEIGRQKQAEEIIQAEADRKAEAKAKSSAQLEADRLAALQPTQEPPTDRSEILIHQGNYDESKIPQGTYGQHAGQQMPQQTTQQTSTNNQIPMTEQEVTPKNVQQVKTGNMAVIVTAEFEVSVPIHVTADQIKDKLRGMIEVAGITSLTNMSVRKV